MGSVQQNPKQAVQDYDEKMEIELKAVTQGIEDGVNDDLTPDETVIMAARGDHMVESLVDMTVDQVMEGTKKDKKNFLEALAKDGHFGPWEHVTFWFAVENISRVAMAQITRHRHMSFDVRSMRYTDSSDLEPIIPPSAEDVSCRDPKIGVKMDGKSIMLRQFRDAQIRYKALTEAGMPDEDARMVFPLMTGVHMSFSANIRAIMHLLDLRLNAKAQWEAYLFADKVLTEVEKHAPLSFNAYKKYIRNNSLKAP